MTTSDGQHWFARCEKRVQDWLLSDPHAALNGHSFDAVITAGGLPVRRGSTDDHSEAYYLRPADSEYLMELRAAGYDTDGR
ncbi:hypothetical protein DT076_18560 [Desertihabitans brevis]|uniref:Uncharacterized protein n=1 Tax=Desertihabitans brevis TaxID=2268447 RepID=A0A367YQ49_9ACTN|nr:hypothetical protein [Desertihabitans brevis]RCK67948.1 hypothetical protein DT076_18560 [Desertihabitans brevis]